jgi:hypothetical protein
MPQDGGEADWFETTAEVTLGYAEQLAGFDESAAESCVKTAGLLWRVVARDGESFAVTEDYIPTRINVVIERTIVTEITVS